MFMKQALALLPQPAALFEWPSLEFVSTNLWHGTPPTWLDEIPDFRRQFIEEDLDFTLEFEGGLLRCSVAEAQPHHARPDLLLMTLHEGGESGLDHLRAKTAILLNEAADVSQRNLEIGMSMLSGAMHVIEEMRRDYNATVQQIMETDVSAERSA